MAQVQELLVRYKGDTKSLKTATNNAKKTVKNFETTAVTSGKRIQASTKQMTTGMAALKGSLVAIAAWKGIQLADQFAVLQSRVENATRSTAEFEQAMGGIKNISRDVGTEIGTTVSIFQRLSFVRDEIEATTDDMLTFTETVSKLGVISGAGTQSLNAGLMQLGQSLSSEIVRAEEFNSIMENIPAVGMAIAKEFGVTTGQLRQLVIEGKVLSGDVFQAILNQSEKTRIEFEKMPMTTARAFAGLKVDLMESAALFNKNSGAGAGLINVIQGIGFAVKYVANVLSGFASLATAQFNASIGAVTGFFTGAMNMIIEAGNIGISVLNKFKSESKQIEPFELLDVEGIEVFKGGLEEAKRAFEDAMNSFENNNDIIGEIFNKGDEAVTTHKEGVEDLKAKYQELFEGISKDADKTKAKMSDLERANNRVVDSLVDSIVDGEDIWDSFRNAAVSALKNIQSEILKTSLNNIFGGGGESGGGGLGGFLTGLGKSVLGGIFGDGTTPKMQTGGSFKVGGAGGTDSQMVQFRASPREQVTVTTPEQQKQNARQGSGGAVVNQTINVSTGVSQTVRAEIQSFLPQFEKIAVSSVRDATSRGKM